MVLATHDLTIRLDESGERIVFFATRKGTACDKNARDFNVEIPLSDLRTRGEAGAERLIGQSVLGFFDHLTDGALALPRHYRDP
jgi:hypothetical protein